jgi:hypothetical protein
MTDYYTSNKKKIIDFLIGFLGAPIVMWILGLTIGSFSTRLPQAGIVGLVFFLFLLIAAPIIAFRKNRRYIGMGMIASTLLLPFLALGACFIMLSGI